MPVSESNEKLGSVVGITGLTSTQSFAQFKKSSPLSQLPLPQTAPGVVPPLGIVVDVVPVVVVVKLVGQSLGHISVLSHDSHIPFTMHGL
jgi:hypothetical protein